MNLPKQHNKIKHIHLFGMMCSGTNHLNKTLRLNLKSIPADNVTEGYVGWKHDDVWSPSGSVDENSGEIVYDKRPSPDIMYSSLVIVIYRNPLTWLQSFSNQTHGAPGIAGIDFPTFLHSPYEGFYVLPGHDESRYERIRSAAARLDRFRERYPSLFVMRRTKIQLFESFKYRVPNVAYVNLENLIDNPETTIGAIAEHFSIDLRERFQINKEEKHSAEPYKPKKYETETYDRDLLTYALQSLYLDEEKAVGYVLRPQFRLIKRGVRSRYPANNQWSVFSLKPQVRIFSCEYGDKVIELDVTLDKGGSND
jgi:hypothetical protein